MKPLIGIIILLLSYNLCFSQVKDSAFNSLQKGSWAVQFEIGRNFTIESFEGAMVALKFHLTKKFALRLGIGADANFRTNNIDELSNNSGYTKADECNNMYSVFSYCNALLYINPDSRLNLFFGAGPRVSLQHSHEEYVNIDDFKKNYDIRDNFEAGPEIIMGCEWFPLRFLSMTGEYSASVMFGTLSSQIKTYDYLSGVVERYENTESSYLSFRGNTVRFGLSVYF